MTPGSNSFDTLTTLEAGGREYHYYSLDKLAKQDLGAITRLPYSLKILLENLLRFERGSDDASGDIRAFAEWLESRGVRGWNDVRFVEAIQEPEVFKGRVDR